jgi:hypothetical protein
MRSINRKYCNIARRNTGFNLILTFTLELPSKDTGLSSIVPNLTRLIKEEREISAISVDLVGQWSTVYPFCCFVLYLDRFTYCETHEREEKWTSSLMDLSPMGE